jgi:hypothetical protein
MASSGPNIRIMNVRKTCPPQISEMEGTGREVSDGIFLERRQFLALSLGVVAAVAQSHLYARTDSAGPPGPEPGLPWEILVARTLPLAKRLIAEGGSGEEAYLSQLSALMRARTTTPRALIDPSNSVGNALILRQYPIVILQFRLVPGAAIPYHNHRGYIGLLAVTDGSLRMRSFEVVGQEPMPAHSGAFLIRETHDVLLSSGQQSTLSRARDNIHGLRAGPKGARFIDFFTYFKEDAHSEFLEVDKVPRDPKRRIFEAYYA